MNSSKDVRLSLAGMPYATGETEIYGIYASVLLSEGESFIHMHMDKVDMEIIADVFLLLMAGYTMGIETVTKNPQDYDLYDEDTARESFVNEAYW